MWDIYKRKVLSYSIFGFLLLIPLSVSAISATATGGVYSVPTNWDIVVVPCNDLSQSYEVTIPVSSPMTLDAATANPCVVNTFDLGENATFALNPSTSYEVIGQANIAGFINGLGGNLNAPMAAFLGNTARLSATNGSTISVGANDWSTTGLINAAILTSSGSGSVLHLPSLQSLNTEFDATGAFGSQWQQINVANGGTLDLSSLQTLTTAVRSADYLDVNVTSGTTLNMSALQSVSGGGWINFDVIGAGSAVDLSSLQTLNTVGRSMLNVSSNASMNFNNLLTVNGAYFNVATGGSITTLGSPWTYDSSALINAVLFNVNGSGSVLNLSSLQNINGEFDAAGAFGSQWQQINVANGGTLDLSGLQALTTPVRSADYLDVNVTSGTTLNMSALPAITGGGWINFDVSGAGSGVDLSSLQTLNTVGRSAFNVSSGATMNFNSLSAVNGAYFNVATGGSIYALGSPWAYDSSALINAVLFNVDGTDSVLNLSSLQSINSGFDATGTFGSRWQQINVSNGGTLDLSGLNSITLPFRSADYLDVNVGTNSTLKIASLVDNDITGSGSMNLDILDPTSKVIIPGSFFAPKRLYIRNVPEAAQLVVGGNFSFKHSIETDLDLEAATVEMNGVANQWMEIGGENLGPVVPPANNFGIGQLVVGQDSQATTLQILDLIDNGNGWDICGSGEALYLLGQPNNTTAPDGLYIKGGSKLVLNGHSVYAMQSGVMVHLNSLLGSGNSVGWDGGTIERGVELTGRDSDSDGIVDISDNCPLVANADQSDTDTDGYGNACDPDFNNDGVVNAADLAFLKANFFTSNPNADLDNSGFVNAADLAILKRMYFQPPGPSCVAP